MPEFEGENPLRPIATAWVEKIKLAWDVKQTQFQKDADEAMRFFHEDYDFMYEGGYARKSRGFSLSGEEDMPAPSFRMTTNKVAELVQIFGPALYHRNPVRQVNPRRPAMVPIDVFGDPNDPMVQLQYQQASMQVNQERTIDKVRANLLEFYLNYTPTALDLKTESRSVIDETLIKGMGIMLTETYQPAGSQTKLVGSFYRTIDDLVVDCDMESLENATWCAIRCIHPYWQVEQEYRLPTDSLKKKGSLESYEQQAAFNADPNGDYNRRKGNTNDLVVYWKLYSKMGAGGKLAGVREDMRALDVFGDYVYLVLAKDVPFPLNLPPDVIATAPPEEIARRLQWPTPFWRDDAWPFTYLAFHRIPRKVWPMSHIKPAMGELKFLSWAYSMMATKLRITCRDFLAVSKSASEELKAQITHGTDYTMIEVEALHESIDKVVKFLQHPDFNPAILKVVQEISVNFEKRTGLTELAYGMSGNQLRSAEEASVKGDQMAVRPDDMANKVEDFMTDIARKEALAARWHLTSVDVAPVMGPSGGQWWDQFVAVSDPSEIIHQLEYRIESGSVKKPNRARDAANMQAAMTALLQPLFQYTMATTNVGPFNALIAQWAKSIDLDPSPFLLTPPPPPPQPPPPTAPVGKNGTTTQPLIRR